MMLICSYTRHTNSPYALLNSFTHHLFVCGAEYSCLFMAVVGVCFYFKGSPPLYKTAVSSSCQTIGTPTWCNLSHIPHLLFPRFLFHLPHLQMSLLSLFLIPIILCASAFIFHPSQCTYFSFFYVPTGILKSVHSRSFLSRWICECVLISAGFVGCRFLCRWTHCTCRT